MTSTHSSRTGMKLIALLIACLVPAYAAIAQGDGGGGVGVGAENVVQDAESLVALDLDELRIQLAPVPLEDLESVRDRALAILQVHSTQLATSLVEQIRLGNEAEPDAARVASVDEEVKSRAALKKELIRRINIVFDAVEQKGGDAKAGRAYVSAIESLVADGPTAAHSEPVVTENAPPDAEEVTRQRVSELVAIIRAEPAAHERLVPWEVPLSEFELELQPLPVETILERLEKWREILQREVRKRVRIDILLNDSTKLEQTQDQRREASELLGVSLPPVDSAAIKSRLAERSQEQQQIINEIVRRMEVAIRLVERRGGDAEQYTKYIAAATGQKLNLTDASVLRAQLMAWVRSPDGGVKIGLNIVKFLGVVVMFWLVSRILGALVGAAVTRVPKASSLLGPVLVGVTRRVTMFIGIVIGASMLGVNIGPLLAMIGAAGLVVGLALQGTLSNFASGILILLNRPYDVGHVIEGGGVFGKVEAMNLVSTSILTFDNQLMLVPNNQIWNGVIKNVNGKPTRRVDMTFGISYADDMDKAIATIRKVIAAHPKVLEDPVPVIRIHELADNSVNLIARPWSNTPDYWEVFWDVTHRVKAEFDEEGINIPFPQRDIHVPGTIEVKLSRERATT